MLPPEPGPSDGERVRVLERRLARERAARAEAESITERVTSELYEAVQQLTRSTRMAEMLSEIATHANEAVSVERAVAAALSSVCTYTGWPVGHALVRSLQAPHSLASMKVWHVADDHTFTEFREGTEGMSFPSGVGLPGRILASGEPLWLPDLATQDKLPRNPLALACGLRAAFGIPVLIRSETEAVLEFFATEIHPPDEGLLRVIGFVGAQLGRVMEREAAEERLTQLALYDGLTGLPNRTLLMDRLANSLTRTKRYGSRVDVLFLDVDDFKTINDSQGHLAGDQVLAAVAARILEAVRQTDSVGRPTTSTVARLGGDEFAVVLDDCAEPRIVAERIEGRLKEPLRLPTTEIFVSVSIGTAGSSSGTTPEELLAAANVAMHEAKRAGKGRYIAFEPQMQEQARRRHSLGEELHRAIDNREFVLAFQPIVKLSDGQIIGAEALLRWEHPSGLVVAPNDFIPRAEETGLVLAIGAWVLGEACRQARGWRQRYPDFSVSVNVSGRQLREPDFADIVRAALIDSELEPEALCLEMTESILMERDLIGIGMLTELRQSGIHLAIDDFGTGFSSLAALRRLPVDLVKIDRSFVASLPEDDDAGTIAWAVVRLGHTLGISVLAEGVETPEQRDALGRFGCDQAQGYLFGHPVPAKEFGELLAAQAARR